MIAVLESITSDGLAWYLVTFWLEVEGSMMP